MNRAKGRRTAKALVAAILKGRSKGYSVKKLTSIALKTLEGFDGEHKQTGNTRRESFL